MLRYLGRHRTFTFLVKRINPSRHTHINNRQVRCAICIIVINELNFSNFIKKIQGVSKRALQL